MSDIQKSLPDPILCDVWSKRPNNLHAGYLLGTRRTKTLELADEGQFETVKVGRRRKAVVASVRELAKKGSQK